MKERRENKMPRKDQTGPRGKGPRTGRGMWPYNKRKLKRDGTGPEGKGPLTGKGLGPCSKKKVIKKKNKK